MRVTLVAAISLDSKITKGADPHVENWASEADQKHFFSLIDQATVIIMGANGYRVVKKRMKHRAGRLRVVMTHNPQQFQDEAIEGQLEFSSQSPTELVDRFSQGGHKELLLVGGSKTYTQFLKGGLVDRLILTIEPYIFGSGIPLVADEQVNAQFELASVKKLNDQGTLLLSYKVKK